MLQLSHKKMASCEQEADKERSKKVCLEQSVAKTLLTLDCQTGISTEEYAVATALYALEQG